VEEAMLSKLTAAHESKKSIRMITTKASRWRIGGALTMIRCWCSWLESTILLEPNGPSYRAKWRIAHQSNAANATTIA
jgi:hypothetical protein